MPTCNQKIHDGTCCGEITELRAPASPPSPRPGLWISVDEKSPVDWGHYLAAVKYWDGGNIRVRTKLTKWECDWLDLRQHEEVTHWMPLPEPPPLVTERN
jgi:hypothetical protein